MQIYHFKFNGYAESYTVLHYSVEQALESVKEYIKESETFPENDTIKEYIKECIYPKWERASVTNLPVGYSIVVYKVGKVLETELS